MIESSICRMNIQGEDVIDWKRLYGKLLGIHSGVVI
jgi:hypothetical protein